MTIEGLQINVPPRGDRGPNDERASSRADRQPRSPFVIASIVADGTTLHVLPRKSGKEPLEFDIRHLRLHSVGIDRPMEFDAELSNAKPSGIIRSQLSESALELRHSATVKCRFRPVPRSMFREECGTASGTTAPKHSE